MKFESAIKRSIKSFQNGNLPEKLIAESGEVMFTPEYFDKLEEDMDVSQSEEELDNGDTE